QTCALPILVPRGGQQALRFSALRVRARDHRADDDPDLSSDGTVLVLRADLAAGRLPLGRACARAAEALARGMGFPRRPARERRVVARVLGARAAALSLAQPVEVAAVRVAAHPSLCPRGESQLGV